jgi:glycosyltransferase involved in cell wall biosynthesis
MSFTSVPSHNSENKLSKSHHNKNVKNNPNQPDLTVIGNVILSDGIGKQSIELIGELKDSLEISFIPTHRITPQTMGGVRPDIRKILNYSGVVNQGKVLILEVFPCVPSYQLKPTWSWNQYGIPRTSSSQIRYAFSVFESTKIPPNWVSIFNNHFDGVIVADPFLVDVYKNSGVTVPVFFLPLGIDLKDFLEAPIKRTRSCPMVFANFGVCATRKNTLKIVQAFAKAFGNNPRVKLLLGWKQIWEQQCRDSVTAEITKHNLHNVEIQERCLSRSDYLQRFCKVDCYVSLSCGEGFSIQPREAMALGIPAIVSNSTAQRTICSSGKVRVVPADILIPGKYIWGTFGYYEDCAVSDAANAMLDVYENYDRYLAYSEAERLWVSQYHYPNLRSLYLSVVRPQVIVLGSSNTITKDKIITTDKKLVEKYMKILPYLQESKERTRT